MAFPSRMASPGPNKLTSEVWGGGHITPACRHLTMTYELDPTVVFVPSAQWVGGHGKPSCNKCILSLYHSRATWACLLEDTRGRPDRDGWAVGPPSRPPRPAWPWEVQQLAGRGNPLAHSNAVTICCFKFQSRLLIAVLLPS